jgi:hypothetical protein
MYYAVHIKVKMHTKKKKKKIQAKFAGCDDLGCMYTSQDSMRLLVSWESIGLYVMHNIRRNSCRRNAVFESTRAYHQ